MTEETSQTSNKMSDQEIWKQAGLQDISETQDISSIIEQLLDQMQSKYSELHEGLVTKVKAMDSRLDLLEKNLSDLIDYISSPDAGGAAPVSSSGEQE